MVLTLENALVLPSIIGVVGSRSLSPPNEPSSGDLLKPIIERTGIKVAQPLSLIVVDRPNFLVLACCSGIRLSVSRVARDVSINTTYLLDPGAPTNLIFAATSIISERCAGSMQCSTAPVSNGFPAKLPVRLPKPNEHREESSQDVPALLQIQPLGNCQGDKSRWCTYANQVTDGFAVASSSSKQWQLVSASAFATPQILLIACSIYPSSTIMATYLCSFVPEAFNNLGSQKVYKDPPLVYKRPQYKIPGSHVLCIYFPLHLSIGPDCCSPIVNAVVSLDDFTKSHGISKHNRNQMDDGSAFVAQCLIVAIVFLYNLTRNYHHHLDGLSLGICDVFSIDNVKFDIISISFNNSNFVINRDQRVPPNIPILLQILGAAVSPWQIGPKGSVYILSKDHLVKIAFLPRTSP
ncbi:hypothetical protein HD554DRAFT_2326715 [Boletus coccyginus]|nr:hypothetical protein HD554DRAFT_2326715 [Boletus coccyginus]